MAVELTIVETGSQDQEEIDAPGEPHLSAKEEHSPYLVRWDGPDDPENPKNWSRAKRWYITGIAGLLVLNATFASNAPSGIVEQLIPKFHLSTETATLTIALFVAGYCVGPLLWGPLSEQYGRRPILLIAFFVYTGFQVGSALANNTAAVLIFRPIIQSQKAARKRKATGDDKWHSELDAQDVHWRVRLETVLGRPFKVLFLEPMLIAIALYMSFVYGCIYLLFEAYPIVFTQGHHLNSGASGLMFLPLFCGGITGVVIYLIYYNPEYERLMAKYAPAKVPPEYRLTPAFVGDPLLMISFLWFGWTSYPSIPLYAPLFSGVFMGIGVVFIFLALFNYIIDVYLMVAASALASSTIVRSAFGAGFPLFATQMYVKLNARWASTLLAGIALLLLPIPFVLYRYGAFIRKTSKYAPSP